MYWTYLCVHLKIEFTNILILISLRTKKVTKWVLKVHMSRKQARVKQQIHLCQVVLTLQSLMLSMYLFPKYNYYFRYYIVGGYYFVIIIMKNFSKSSFASLMIFDWLINLFFFVCLYIFSLGTNQHKLYFATSSYDDTTT